MKKISSLLLALCVFCAAFAEVEPLEVADLVAPKSATLQKLAPAKSLKKDAEKAAAFKAQEKKAGKKKLVFAPAAKTAVAAEPVTISGDLEIVKYEGEFYYIIDTDEYKVMLDIFSEDMAGTFTEEDLFSWYSGVKNKETYKTYGITTASIKITSDVAAGTTLTATLLCEDSVTYNVTGYKAPLPVAKDTIKLSYPNASFYNGKTVAQFYARDLFPAVSADSIYATIVLSRTEEDITGIYDDSSVYSTGCYVAYFGKDTTIVDYLEDQISVSVSAADGKYTCQAELLGEDTICYQLTFVTDVPEPVKPKKYVDVIAHNLEVTDMSSFFGLVAFEGSNDEYEAYFMVYTDTLYGTFGTYDLSDYSYIIHGEDTLSILTAELQYENWFGENMLTGTVVASDTIGYYIMFDWQAPEAKDTVKIDFTEQGEGLYFINDGDLYLYNDNSKYIVALDIYLDSIGGEYTADDLYSWYSLVGVINDADTTLLELLTADIKLIDKGNNLCAVEATLLASDTICYQVTSTYVWETKKTGMDYDAQSGELTRTFTGADSTAIKYYEEDNVITFLARSKSHSDEVYLEFFLEEGVTTLPAGTYTIDKSEKPNTVYASDGVDSQGYIYPSFYATYNSETGNITTPLYFLEEGTVVVEYNGENLKITIEALNSFDVPVHIVYDSSLTAIENTTTKASATKFVRNGKLYIQTAEHLYDAAGTQLK